MNYYLILGSNPSKQSPRKGSTFDRLDNWANMLGIRGLYDFDNVIAHHAVKESVHDVKPVRLIKLCRKYDKILTLGKFADMILTRLGIDHYPLPHPSPRNRSFNDPSYEKKTLQNLINSEYLKTYN